MKFFIAVFCLVALSYAAAQNCGRNMKYIDCGNPCERTCREVAEHRPPAVSCIMMCKPAGCYCKPGYVRFYNGQYCVRETECFMAKK